MKRLVTIGGLLVSVLALWAAQSVTLGWNPNTETNLAGYRLHYGWAPRGYDYVVQVKAPATQVTLTNNLQVGKTNYFAVTAFTTDGMESDYSEELAWLMPAPPPAILPPRGLRLITTLQASASQAGPWTNVWLLDQPLPPARNGVATFYRAVTTVASQ